MRVPMTRTTQNAAARCELRPDTRERFTWRFHNWTMMNGEFRCTECGKAFVESNRKECQGRFPAVQPTTI